MNGKKVVVGMSGGVDSSVAAYLLKEEGYDVIGVTMQIWQDEDRVFQEEQGGCCGLSAVDDARRVAAAIGIPHYVMNFKSEFKEKVIDYFLEEYLNGRTPNPCIACNRYVKWESLLKRSLDIGADYIATGHYARIVSLPNGRRAIQTSVTRGKDQTYALYNLTQEQLARTLMPVGDYHKEEIRKIAEKISLRIAGKPDSQDICFVPDGDYAAYIAENTDRDLPQGNFVMKDGTIVGQHKGIIHYTVGQRKGLGIALGFPVFVLEIRPESNEVVLGTKEDTLSTHIRIGDLNLMSEETLPVGRRLWGKIRYNHRGGWCRVCQAEGEEAVCVFEEPQSSPAPGQALVLYDEELVVGGGVIREGWRV